MSSGYSNSSGEEASSRGFKLDLTPDKDAKKQDKEFLDRRFSALDVERSPKSKLFSGSLSPSSGHRRHQSVFASNQMHHSGSFELDEDPAKAIPALEEEIARVKKLWDQASDNGRVQEAQGFSLQVTRYKLQLRELKRKQEDGSKKRSDLQLRLQTLRNRVEEFSQGVDSSLLQQLVKIEEQISQALNEAKKQNVVVSHNITMTDKDLASLPSKQEKGLYTEEMLSSRKYIMDRQLRLEEDIESVMSHLQDTLKALQDIRTSRAGRSTSTAAAPAASINTENSFVIIEDDDGED